MHAISFCWYRLYDELFFSLSFLFYAMSARFNYSLKQSDLLQKFRLDRYEIVLLLLSDGGNIPEYQFYSSIVLFFLTIQIIAERLRYFRDIYHWYRLAQIICVTVYLLHSSHNLAPTQIGFGAVTCLLSWVNVIQFLKLTPMFGIYVIVVEKVFWTLVKVIKYYAQVYNFVVETFCGTLVLSVSLVFNHTARVFNAIRTHMTDKTKDCICFNSLLKMASINSHKCGDKRKGEMEGQ